MCASTSQRISIHTNSKDWAINHHHGYLHLVREDQYTRTTQTIDAFAGNWICGWVEQYAVEVAIRSRNRFIPLRPGQFVFVPPFSVVHWKVEPGILKWHAIVSNKELPPNAPVGPAVFDSVAGSSPTTPEELYAVLSKQVPRLRVIQERTRSRFAPQVRDWLNKFYREDQTIQELAEAFHVSRVYLSRVFSEAYSFSPLEYRQRLRIEDAIYQIIQGKSVTHARCESGFSCSSEFNRQLNNLHGVAPRRFSPTGSA